MGWLLATLGSSGAAGAGAAAAGGTAAAGGAGAAGAGAATGGVTSASGLAGGAGVASTFPQFGGGSTLATTGTTAADLLGTEELLGMQASGVGYAPLGESGSSAPAGSFSWERLSKLVKPEGKRWTDPWGPGVQRRPTPGLLPLQWIGSQDLGSNEAMQQLVTLLRGRKSGF